MDRKNLIRLYLDAETTCEQERELADSFTAVPPADEEEMAVYRMMQTVSPIRLSELPEAGDEFDYEHLQFCHPESRRHIGYTE